jgi:hypothetical protein
MFFGDLFSLSHQKNSIFTQHLQQPFCILEYWLYTLQSQRWEFLTKLLLSDYQWPISTSSSLVHNDECILHIIQLNTMCVKLNYTTPCAKLNYTSMCVKLNYTTPSVKLNYRILCVKLNYTTPYAKLNYTTKWVVYYNYTTLCIKFNYTIVCLIVLHNKEIKIWFQW